MLRGAYSSGGDTSSDTGDDDPKENGLLLHNVRQKLPQDDGPTEPQLHRWEQLGDLWSAHVNTPKQSGIVDWIFSGLNSKSHIYPNVDLALISTSETDEGDVFWEELFHPPVVSKSEFVAWKKKYGNVWARWEFNKQRNQVWMKTLQTERDRLETAQEIERDAFEKHMVENKPLDMEEMNETLPPRIQEYVEQHESDMYDDEDVPLDETEELTGDLFDPWTEDHAQWLFDLAMYAQRSSGIATTVRGDALRQLYSDFMPKVNQWMLDHGYTSEF
jgi:hypothetical protein